MLFVEAKWLKNDILNYFERNNHFDYKIQKTVFKKNFNGELEEKEIKYLCSQM